MSPELASQILQETAANEKEMYRAVSAAVADSRKLRPAFFEKKPKTERSQLILESLTKPRLETTADNLLRHWLLKSQKQILIDFLDALGVDHKEGVIEDLPKDLPEDKIKAGVEKLLAAHPREKVIVYLNVFYGGNKEACPALGQMLEKDSRLHLG